MWSGESGPLVKVCTFNTRAAEDFRRRAAQVGIPSSVDIRTLNSLGWSIIGEVSDAPSANLKAHERRDPVVLDARGGDESWRVRKIVRLCLKE